jgi:SAM-dependent methyltransferase
MNGTDGVARYYTELYDTSRAYSPDPTFFGRLHSLLRRWEAHRTEVVSGLARPGGVLLDVGCGDGDLLEHNLSRYKALFGIDIAANRAVRAGTLSGGAVHAQVGDVDAGLPYREASFDVVTCVAVLEHVFDPIALVQDLARVLKPNGQLIVEVPNVAFLSRRFGLLLGELPRTAFNEPGWDGGHLHYFTFATLEQLFVQCGLHITDRTCAGIAHRLRAIRPQLLAADIILVATKLGPHGPEADPHTCASAYLDPALIAH